MNLIKVGVIFGTKMQKWGIQKIWVRNVDKFVVGCSLFVEGGPMGRDLGWSILDLHIWFCWYNLSSDRKMVRCENWRVIETG